MAKSSIVKWDANLEKEAEAAAAMVGNIGGGRFLTVKGGILTLNDAPVEGNTLPVIIVDHIFENVKYDGEFDPDNPTSPSCFAFGRDEKTMEPHEVVKEAGTAEEGPCLKCPLNQFGSAEKGKGKACKNTIRLAVLVAGTFQGKKLKLVTDADYWPKTDLLLHKLPVTSVKPFAAYVKQLKLTLKLPPFAMISKMTVVPDAKTQFKVTFEPIQKLPDSIGPAVMARRDEAKGLIDAPYQPREDEAPKPAKGKAKKGKY